MKQKNVFSDLSVGTSFDPPVEVVCSRGSLSVCLAGECQSVGCDLRLRSRKVLDHCGVCGGDGSSCLQERRRFVWRPGPLSACSTTCGQGQEVWGHLCTDITTDQTVHQVSYQDPSLSPASHHTDPCQEFCDLTTRPSTDLRACNVRACPARSVRLKLCQILEN